MKEPDIQPLKNTTTEEPRKQPSPWSTPGRWTITTESGSTMSGYLPAWAEDDPSEVALTPAGPVVGALAIGILLRGARARG